MSDKLTLVDFNRYGLSAYLKDMQGLLFFFVNNFLDESASLLKADALRHGGWCLSPKATIFCSQCSQITQLLKVHELFGDKEVHASFSNAAGRHSWFSTFTPREKCFHYV